MSRAVLSLGSNLGDRVGYLRLAVDGLRDVLVAVSSVYETKPWGVTDQTGFPQRRVHRRRPRPGPLGVAADGAGAWSAGPSGCGNAAGGHARSMSTWSRWTRVRSDDPELLLPHPGTHERATVLIPWLEIDPDAEVPGRGRAADLLAALDEDDRAGVRLRADVVL